MSMCLSGSLSEAPNHHYRSTERQESISWRTDLDFTGLMERFTLRPIPCTLHQVPRCLPFPGRHPYLAGSRLCAVGTSI